MNMKRASQKWAAAVLLAAVLLGCFPAGVFAQETADEPGSGWLVRLQEDTVGLLSEEESQALTAIHAETGLYRTEDPEALAELQASGLVDYAEPDGVAVLLEGDADPLAKEQWYLDTLGAAAAWESGLAGDGVTVAIIDSGLNAGHEDLSQANILSGWNVLTDSDDVTDTVGHGTFIAGLLAAGRDNGIGISGLTPQVELVPIQCFSDGNRTSVSYIIAAIYLAVDRYGSDVINLSLGTETPSQSLTDAVTYALEHGAIVVSAVGNTGGTQYLYPAADSRVVGVGSVGQTLGVSSFSQRNDSVFVVAPGEQIISLSHTDAAGYTSGKGTSFSTPFVSALAVMAKDYDPSITAAEFQELLRTTSRDLGEPGYDEQYGYGLMDMAAFVDALTQGGTEQPETGFTDISGHWAEESILYVTERGLMQGESETLFAPERSLTRGMLVTILYRLYLSDGGSAVSAGSPFADVPADAWYAQAVAWAAENGVITGITETSFAPDQAVTREQMVTMLQRYVRFTGGTADGNPTVLTTYTDAGNVALYAVEAMAWAVEQGIITGMTADTLVPQGTSTRAQIAAVFQRWLTAA